MVYLLFDHIYFQYNFLLIKHDDLFVGKRCLVEKSHGLFTFLAEVLDFEVEVLLRSDVVYHFAKRLLAVALRARKNTHVFVVLRNQFCVPVESLRVRIFGARCFGFLVRSFSLTSFLFLGRHRGVFEYLLDEILGFKQELIVSITMKVTEPAI